jgi:hypothetical protein
MDDKALIGKIKELRQIKPNQNWVFLTKNRILGQEISRGKIPTIADFLPQRRWELSPLRLLFLKPAYAGLLALLIIVGLFGFAQNSVPGDYLYPIKRIAEKSQALFASDRERARMSLELVNKRLEELTRIVEDNQTKKLAPAIREFQGSLSEAANNFSGSDQNAIRQVVEVRQKTQELQSRGVIIDQEGLQILEMESLIAVLEDLIADLENRTLTTKQELLLDTMKELVEDGRHSDALELFLRNQ